MTLDEWQTISKNGRRWALFAGMAEGADANSPIVRVIRWHKSGVRVRFPDGHEQTVHPGYLHAAAS